jgi:hypothetical protein
MKKIITALAAASMLVAPTFAAAASAPAASLSVVRAGASMDGESDLAGGNIVGYVFLAAFLAAAVYAAIKIGDDNGDRDDYAVSP